MVDIQQARRGRWARPGRILGLPLVAWLVLVIVVCMLAGALLTVVSSQAPAPAIPAAATPPRTRSLGASQVTQQLGSNQITSTALYRSAASPAVVIARYRRAVPNGGRIGRFDIVVRDARDGAVPTALPDLPSTFADGTGAARRVRYTFTEYEDGNRDIGIAVDLRHPRGPTLVFVEMLSS